MSQELLILLGSAIGIGCVHTLLGPDHYIPFIMMCKARGWTLTKTAWITLACGIGHVLGSIVLGLIGIGVGIALKRLELIESVRGDIAAWMVIAFGLAYFAWGVRRSIRNKPHSHHHDHLDDGAHDHEHSHHREHAHPHPAERQSITPWVLFTIFVFGPCEPLIPLLMYPAATEGLWQAALVATVFGAATVGTMMGIVLLSAFGLSFVTMKPLERHSHAIAGAAVFLCGVAILLGL